MAANITRTVKTFKAAVVDFTIDADGKPALVEGESVEYSAPSDNDAAARAAFKAAGKPQKRGTRFVHSLVREELWGMPLDVFMAHAVRMDKDA